MGWNGVGEQHPIGLMFARPRYLLASQVRRFPSGNQIPSVGKSGKQWEQFLEALGLGSMVVQ